MKLSRNIRILLIIIGLMTATFVLTGKKLLATNQSTSVETMAPADQLELFYKPVGAIMGFLTRIAL